MLLREDVGLLPAQDFDQHRVDDLDARIGLGEKSVGELLHFRQKQLQPFEGCVNDVSLLWHRIKR